MKKTIPTQLEALSRLGLSEGEITIYSILLEEGSQSVSELIATSGLKKGDCYNKIYALQEKGLLEEFEDHKKKHFKLVDPRKLDEVASTLYKEAAQAKREVEAILPSILSTYTLTYNQPGIIVFEGEEAIRRIQDDSLSSSDEILQIIDSESVNKYVPDVNSRYVSQRIKARISKRLIMPDTSKNRERVKSRPKAYTQHTEVRFLSVDSPSFKTSFIQYGNKISYLTVQPDTTIGVIIEDQLIAQMHRTLFEVLWQQSLPV